MKKNNLLNKEITIQIVLYEESIDLIYKCLNNLKDFNVILIDNAGNKNLKLRIEENFKIFKYILNKKNTILVVAGSGIEPLTSGL